MVKINFNQMKKTKYLFQFLLVILCLGFTSCQEDDSPTEGPQGEQGPPGEDGNANVIASAWIVEQYANEATAQTGFDIPDPNITQTIIDSGLVLAFGKANSSNVISIPFVYDNKSYYIVLTPDQKIRFVGTSVDFTPEVFNDITHVRYVIIPASTAGKNEGVDYAAMSYEELMDYFGLQK